MEDVQLLLRYDAMSNSVHVVWCVPDDGNAWTPLLDERLPPSSVASVLAFWCRLWLTIQQQT